MQRLHILITGQVQGVGFRPHVYCIAQKLKLTGWVQNNASGVRIEIQGTATADFLPQLSNSLPPLARIDEVKTQPRSLLSDESTFQIIQSQAGDPHTIIPPDTAICDDCLNELFDPNSRYYHYPFLNCTHCGPRLTITRALPYDRRQTSMAEFPLCNDCLTDYKDPTNRRYHAQPTACPQCGPKLSCNMEDITQALQDGKIVAIKGLGGYQLLCDATNEHAINTLRQRKNRDQKPFAIMTTNTQTAALIVEVDAHAQQLLTSQARPIALLRKREATHHAELPEQRRKEPTSEGSCVPDRRAQGCARDRMDAGPSGTQLPSDVGVALPEAKLPESIAPGLSHLGIMLPSTPLHYLILNTLQHTSPLIVTSANQAGNPLIIDDEKAQNELSTIADLIVTYNRQIVTRADDSVIRIINNKPAFIRRARGYTPKRIKLPHPIPPTLALGSHLKNTFCITREDEAFVSQHIGSLNNKETIEFFEESLTHWLRLLDVKPERIAHDLHPDFYTTHLARDYNRPAIAVQHHHAHLAAVAAEHHILKPAVGLALDGYGYGTDGKAWGGELLLLDNANIERLGSFLPVPLPGGETAVREPWRMAASILHCLNKTDQIEQRFKDKPQASMLANLLKTQSPIPQTRSCGRLFDAASALLGINTISAYEGQAAMQLESLVSRPDVLLNGWSVEHDQFSLLPTFDRLLDLNPIEGANLFHGTLIAGLTEWLTDTAHRVSSDIILLSGGCFLNKIISEGLYNHLTQHGLKVYLPQRVPANDGGLSLGQAWIAGTKRISPCV